MVGDQADFVQRLRTVLPARWFGDVTPILDTVLNGLAAGWVFVHELLQYTRRQTRVSTASDVWLDLVARDFFGHTVTRMIGQTDPAFRTRIYRNILRERGTRAALVGALSDLTGRVPVVFEPRNTSDTGGYGHATVTNGSLGGGLGYGVSGGWGNLSLPYQCFLTVFRPIGNGTANVSGWTGSLSGYGVGPLEYADLDIIRGHVGDADILREITSIIPVGVVVWTRISS